LKVKSISEEELLDIYYTREALEGMARGWRRKKAGPIELANLHASTMR